MKASVMSDFTHDLQANPLIGFALSVIHLAVGSILGLIQQSVPNIEENHIPLLFMQLFQIGAWSAAIFAGLMTGYGVWKTHHGKKNIKSKEDE